MGVGKNIKEILKEKEMTIKDLSEISGVSLNTLYSITKRDSNAANIEIIKKIANALEVPYTDLLNDDVESKEESYRLTQNACMKLALNEFNIKVSSTMAEAIMNEFFRLMVLHGYLRKED